MKKLILLLSMFLCVMVGAKTLTDSEKKEMLRQFSEFQQAVRNKDDVTLKKMIKFPISREILSIVGYENGRIFYHEYNLADLPEEAPVTEKVFSKYKENAFRNLSKLDNLKVDLNKNIIIGYSKDGASVEDKKRKFKVDSDDDRGLYVYYLDKKNYRVETGAICDLNVTGEFVDDELHVTYGLMPNKLMTEPEMAGMCHIFTEWYTFINDNGKLKLAEITSMD